ncbi:MAG: leucine-rich repeat domain-containing protein [Microcoleaceae cyanobacterium]
MTTLNINDYAALKALYESTNGGSWRYNSGWKNWDFNSATPPEVSVVENWRGVTLEGDRVTELSLENNKLSGEIPAELGNLTNLEYLYLNDNQLNGEISPELQTFIDNLYNADIQNPPYEISLDSYSVDERLETGSVVGWLESKDINSEDQWFSYELVSGEGDTDNALFEIVYDELQTKAVFDYETKDSYSIRVQTSDDHGGTFEQQLTIYINDAPDEEVKIIGDLIEDSTLFAEVFDPDGIASPIEYQWQSSKNGINWTDIAGATDEAFTPGDEEAGRHLQVNVSYSDYDGNFESIAVTGDITFEPIFAGTFNGYYGGNVSMVVVEDYAYVTNSDILEIFDVSNPQNPILAGYYDSSDYLLDVSVVGNYAYISDDYGGLEIIDVSNPENPILVGSYDTDGYGGSVSVLGDYAYITDYETLEIIDISNPQTPTLAGTYDTNGYVQDISVVGNYAYINIDNNGLQIVDISDPQTPTLASTFYTANSYNDVHDIAVAGRYAYIANDNLGLKIVDISNPQNPIEVERYHPDGRAVGVSVAGNYAYITNNYGDLEIVDISDRQDPTLAGRYETMDTAFGVSVIGDYAYVADDRGGLQIINLNATIPVVENINDEPTGVTLNNTRIAEQSKTGRVVGRLSTVDPDPNDFHTYWLIDDAGGRFAISEDNKLVVADGSLLDAGSNSSHVVTVKTTDSGGYSYYEEELTIDVIEVVKPKGDATDNVLEGTSAIDQMRGLAGDDTLNGYADNDILNGGLGADIMIGGTGDDAYFVDDTADQVIEAVDEGIDRVISLIDYTLPENVEKLILRGNEWINGIGNDLRNVIKGNDASNVIRGNEGNDRLFGNGGNDELVGGAGRDILEGGDGYDTLTGGSGRDRFIISFGNGDDIITDFQDGQDRLKLEEGLTFENLSIETIGFNDTEISSDYETLAILEGVDASFITSEDFI